MHLYFGTVVRGARLRDGGELVKLDWESKSIVAKAPVLLSQPRIERDPNPRGNTRGFRGVAVENGHVIAANYHTLQVYDSSLNHLRSMSHGLMVDLHELYCPSDGTIWVTSTALDAVLQYDLGTGELLKAMRPRQMKGLQRALNLLPDDWNLDEDYRTKLVHDRYWDHPSHLHVNAVARSHGDFYALFNKCGAIVNLSRSHVVVSDIHLRGAHNLVTLDDETVVVNDTWNGFVRRYDLSCGKLVWACSLAQHPWVRSVIRWAKVKYRLSCRLHSWKLAKPAIGRPLFVRGLTVHQNQVFVGLSPGAIVCLDLTSGNLDDAYQYSKDVHVCVHGLCLPGSESSNGTSLFSDHVVP